MIGDARGGSSDASTICEDVGEWPCAVSTTSRSTPSSTSACGPFARHRRRRRPPPPTRKPTPAVFGGVRKLDLLLNVFDRNQTGEIAVLIDHRQLFDSVPVQDRLASSSVVPAGAVMRLSLVITSLIGWSDVVDEAKIAVGQDADQLARLRR